mgnify:CR=1 FL=1
MPPKKTTKAPKTTKAAAKAGVKSAKATAKNDDPMCVADRHELSFFDGKESRNEVGDCY